MYKAAMYLRTSKNDIKKENSIYMQQKVIYNYVETKPDIVIVERFIDKGYSGLDFFRPSFRKMVDKIMKGEINCVIVKDLSRLGRDYIQTGVYLQYFFPQNNVRCIAINDYYDSEKATDVEKYFMIPFRNYINDMYSRDISKKVRSALSSRRENGICTLNKVPYGYIKNNGLILVDEKVENVIKNIFERSLEGYSLQGIANILNSKNIVTPMNYRENGYITPFKKYSNNKWYPMMVKRILTNEMYIGTLVQGKVVKPSYKMNIRKKVDEEGWYRKENNHPAIIDKKTFNIVNYLLKYDVRRRKGEEKCSNLSGVLLCDKCKKIMIYRNGNKPRYICGSYVREGTCNNWIYEKDINEIIRRIYNRITHEYEEGIIERKRLVYVIKNIYVCGENRIRVFIYDMTNKR